MAEPRSFVEVRVPTKGLKVPVLLFRTIRVFGSADNVEDADPARWERVRELLGDAEQSLEILDCGEKENVQTLFRHVIRDAKFLPR